MGENFEEYLLRTVSDLPVRKRTPLCWVLEVEGSAAAHGLGRFRSCF